MATVSIKIPGGITGVLLLIILCLVSCDGKNEPGPPSATVTPARCLPRIVGTLPHDENAFTQGLCHDRGILYESTGLRGESSLRTLDTNCIILSKQSLPENVFAEGCALLADNLYQLTWQEQQCFVYSLPGLSCIDTLSYSGEGWGLTTYNAQLIMSNGSDTLYFRDRGLNLLKKIAVTCDGQPLTRLNELEYVQARNRLYANVWYSDYVFEIDPRRGIVERIIDCSELVAREAPSSDECVLNGIAYIPENGRFYLTGKKWKNVFVVEIPAP
jgi:glutaminyl-peptide cyclotransferase